MIARSSSWPGLRPSQQSLIATPFLPARKISRIGRFIAPAAVRTMRNLAALAGAYRDPATMAISSVMVCAWLSLSILIGCGGGASSTTPTGTSPSPAPSTDFTLTVSPPAITALTNGSNSTFAVSTAGRNGFSGQVAITLSGLPTGVTTSPASPFSLAAGSSQTVALTIPPTLGTSNFTVTATGTSAGLSHSAQLAVTLQDFNITISPPTITARAGTYTAMLSVSATGQNGFSNPVVVALAGLPAGVTTSPAFPVSMAVGSTQNATLVIAGTASPGNFTLSASGTSAGLNHSAQLDLTVQSTQSAPFAVTTWHYDNGRTSADTSETLLTPSNVNTTTFKKLFTLPVDGFIVGQPLYLAGVSIPGQGTHNVVYVATMHDSVYAFDADTGNTAPLWMTSIFNYSPAGATTVPATVKKNAGTTGWSEIGIVSTPVIDAATGTLYVVAETYESGAVVHRLHALDTSSGIEKFGGPTTITATDNSYGYTTTFTDLYQLNRPGLLLVNNHIYIAWGSNCCNNYSQGWVLSYNASTLQQEGAYNPEPGHALASIWQKGAGISADSSGNVYVETSEGFYVPGSNPSLSVLKLSQIGSSLALADWFTPYNYQYLNSVDLDLNDAVMVLPDQPGPTPHEAIAEGKEGTIYVLDRDNMGQLCSSCTVGDTQIVQELPLGAGPQSGTPVYWNNTVYFTGQGSPVYAYTLSSGSLVTPPKAQSIQLGGGGHAILTANGTSNAVLWFINGGGPLWALDAATLATIYTSDQAANGRDKMPPLPHFATPIAANGKIYVGTQNSLVIYGLF